ncbi:IMA5 protein, partial [Acromyrmex heyeri]
MSSRGNYDHILTTNFKVYIKDEELLEIKKDEMDVCRNVKEIRWIKRDLKVLKELFHVNRVLSSSDLSVLNEIANNINSSDETLQLTAFQMYTKLGRERNTVNDMIKGGILSRCIELLDSDNICLQSEVISLLAVITSRGFEESQNYIKYEAIPKLMKLLKSTSSIIVGQTLYMLGNIIDIPYARDLALEHDAISVLVDLIKPDTSVIFMDRISWLLSNLCLRNPPLSLELIKPLLPVFDRLLNSENNSIISDTCRILYYLTDGVNDNIQAIMETGILPKILDCLISKMKSIFIPAWFTVRNIVVMGDNTQRDAVISGGGLSRLRSLYWYYANWQDIIAKEILWLICKMASNTDQIQSVIDAGLLVVLVNEILFGNAKVIAIWAITTMITKATIQQFNQFVNAGILAALCNLLSSNDTNIINALTGLTKILHAAEKIGLVEKLTIMIKKIGGLDKIEDLQQHKNEKVYKKSLAIINVFFSKKTEPELPSSSTKAIVPSFLPINETVPKIVQDLPLLSDKALQILAIQVYSKLFNSKTKSFTSDILESDVLSRCIELLDSDNFVLQVELISLLTAVTTNTFSKKAQYVIKNGIISKLVKLFKSSSSNVVEQAVHSLGVIIKDRPYARDLALEQNALPSLVDLIKPDIPTESICNIVRTLTYLCKKSDSALSLELIRPVLPIFNYLFNSGNQDYVNPELRSNTCKMLSYVTYKSNHNIRAILETGILLKIFECLTSKDENILIPALQTIRNIVEMDEATESDALILADCLPYFCSLLQNYCINQNITKEIVSIIFGMINNMNQIQNVLDAGLLPPMIKIFVFVRMARKMTEWTLMDLISRATSQHLTELVNADILLALCSLLGEKNYEYIISALNGLNNIWDVAEKVNQREKLVTTFKEAGGLDKLKALQYHEHEIIYEKSMIMISSLFS